MLKQQFRRFKYAFQGIIAFFGQDVSGTIHLVLAAVAVIAGFMLKISVLEWLAVIICIGVVIAAEMLNSAIERLANVVSPEIDASIKYVKDVAAAAVLVVSLMALAVGVLIFVPKLF